MVNLNDLVLGPSPATRPFGINNKGWIVGVMASNMGGRAFLLIPLATVQAEVDIQPDTMTPKSRGRYVTCLIELRSDDRTVWDVVPESLCLQGNIYPAGAPVYGDADGDSVPDMMVKFSRDALLRSLAPGMQTVELTGILTDETEILGQDTIRVLAK
jgi:hypothetical protein